MVLRKIIFECGFLSSRGIRGLKKIEGILLFLLTEVKEVILLLSLLLLIVVESKVKLINCRFGLRNLCNFFSWLSLFILWLRFALDVIKPIVFLGLSAIFVFFEPEEIFCFRRPCFSKVLLGFVLCVEIEVEIELCLLLCWFFGLGLFLLGLSTTYSANMLIFPKS